MKWLTISIYKDMAGNEIHADSKEEFRAILNDYLKDKPNVKIVKIIENF